MDFLDLTLSESASKERQVVETCRNSKRAQLSRCRYCVVFGGTIAEDQEVASGDGSGPGWW
jgi:hypothetical protein